MSDTHETYNLRLIFVGGLCHGSLLKLPEKIRPHAPEIADEIDKQIAQVHAILFHSPEGKPLLQASDSD